MNTSALPKQIHQKSWHLRHLIVSTPSRACGCICLQKKTVFQAVSPHNLIAFVSSLKIQIKSYCQIAHATATIKNLQRSEMLKPKKDLQQEILQNVPRRSSTGCDWWLFQYLDTKRGQAMTGCYLEDPSGAKWLISMVMASPLRIGLWDPFHMVINGGYSTNHLLTGIILQVVKDQRS